MNYSREQQGPKVVKNGLLFYIDAANHKSYPRSGTDWLNLTPYQYSASLVNGPAFNNTNIGSIVFDGTNDYAAITPDSVWGFGTTSFSVGVWFKTTEPTDAKLARLITNDTGTTGGFWMISGQTNAIFFSIWSGSRQTADSYSTIHLTTVNDGNWHYVVGVRDYSNSIKLYYDGILRETKNETVARDITPGPGSYPALCRLGSFNGFYSNYTVGATHIYNRALSASEVLQNYNAFKFRFGIYF